MPGTIHKTPDGEEITVVPANEASWDDLQTIFGPRGDAHKCQCQRYKFRDMNLVWVPRDAREQLLQDQTNCGDPTATSTSGLVGYLDGEPVAWCAVEPRSTYIRLIKMRVPWLGREEDPEDESVWAVTCFTVRTGYRRRGISYALAAATIDYAREQGARALEGYAMETQPGKEITWGELHVGPLGAFEAAGFRPVGTRTLRRCVMRVDFA